MSKNESNEISISRIEEAVMIAVAYRKVAETMLRDAATTQVLDPVKIQHEVIDDLRGCQVENDNVSYETEVEIIGAGIRAVNGLFGTVRIKGEFIKPYRNPESDGKTGGD